MSERPTREITTPDGHNIVVHSYLTVRDTLPVLGDDKLSNQQKSHKLAVAAIVSLDGSSDDIDNRLLDMKLPDYTYLLNNIKDLIDGGFPEAK